MKGDIFFQDEIDQLSVDIDHNNSEKAKSSEIFSFKDILDMKDHEVQYTVSRTTIDELAKALIHEDGKIRKKFYKNMSLTDLTVLDGKLLNIEQFNIQEKRDAQRKILSIITNIPEYRDTRFESGFRDIEEFEAFLTKRHQPEDPYGIFDKNIGMCRFFETKGSEEILADIERKNKEQGMGSIEIPHTKIKLINYSICPKCGHVFSFKDLADYYARPRPDPMFKNKAHQFRNDTRVYCYECKTYFLPALIISDGSPKSEVQFLCRIQTMNAIERYYQHKGIKVLSTRKENRLTREEKQKGKTHKNYIRGIRNDTLLKEMEPKPTLISNLLQYTPPNLALNLINGENVKNGDMLFGAWQ